MAGSAEILQQFLVQVGYKTDVLSLKKFEDGLGKTGKAVFGVGTKVAGVVAAVDAAAVAFAYSMRKMYFESELSRSSVKNLEGLEFAGKQAGIAANTLSDAVQQLALRIRFTPGFKQTIEALGIKVTGRDMSDVAMDTVKALSKMPESQGVQWAQFFGFDEKTFALIKDHMGEINKGRKEMAGVYKEMGFDPDNPKNKKVIKDLTHDVDLLIKKFDILGQKILVNFVGPLEKGFHFVNDTIDLISAYTGKTDKEKKEKTKKAFVEDIKGAGSAIKSGVSGAAESASYAIPALADELMKFVIGEKATGEAADIHDKAKYLFNYGMSKGYVDNTAGTRLGASAPTTTTNGPVTLIQKTDINVTGIDAKSTANAVANQQSKVNDQMMQSARDLGGKTSR